MGHPIMSTYLVCSKYGLSVSLRLLSITEVNCTKGKLLKMIDFGLANINTIIWHKDSAR